MNPTNFEAKQHKCSHSHCAFPHGSRVRAYSAYSPGEIFQLARMFWTPTKHVRNPYRIRGLTTKFAFTGYQGSLRSSYVAEKHCVESSPRMTVDPVTEDLCALASRGDVEAIKKSLQEGKIDILHVARSDKSTPLHKACWSGHLGVVQLLVSDNPACALLLHYSLSG